ncbi:MAG: sodium/solute symporter [Labilibaculum sp.]|nr:sodium/solute symporter [Labilibaculum sp.]MBI9057567.1 sodium/solute symporter [Labilibaculum sp.]
MKLHFIDYIIITIYILVIVGIGVYTGIKNKKKTSEGFFLAGRNLRWPMIGAALFAANISTIHMVGLAGQGFSDGLVWGNFEWSAAILLILLGLIFAPFYFKTKISTLPEFLEKRYNPQTRSVLAFISLVTAIFLHIGVSLYAGGLVFENFFGIDRYMAITIIAVITFIYAFIVGLEAVVITEAVQSVVLILGASIMTILAMLALPDVGINSIADFKDALKPHQISMIHTHEGSPLPWWAFWLGIPVLGINYWCADQTIVQKVLGAKTLEDAQRGPIFAGFIKILPVFIMVVPGIFAYLLFKDEISIPDQALPELILRILPTGLKGLMSAALLAALMSTIASGLNSAGTLVSMDIVKRNRPNLNDKAILNIGRATIFVVIIIAVAWSPLIAKFPSIFEAINDLLAVLSPPISVVLLFGVFSRYGTPKAGLYTLILGFALAIITFSIDFEMIAGKRYITDVWGIHFMLKAFYMFALCTVFYFTISTFTPKADQSTLNNLTLRKPLSFLTEGKVKSAADPRMFAAYLLVIMIILYTIFR